MCVCEGVHICAWQTLPVLLLLRQLSGKMWQLARVALGLINANKFGQLIAATRACHMRQARN